MEAFTNTLKTLLDLNTELILNDGNDSIPKWIKPLMNGDTFQAKYNMKYSLDWDFPDQIRLYKVPEFWILEYVSLEDPDPYHKITLISPLVFPEGVQNMIKKEYPAQMEVF